MLLNVHLQARAKTHHDSSVSGASHCFFLWLSVHDCVRFFRIKCHCRVLLTSIPASPSKPTNGSTQAWRL